jgi:dethiobiotin synthetase
VPLVVVTGTHLGTVSHTLTSLEVLKQRGLALKALIVNETPGSAVTLDDTLATIARFSPTMPIIGLPRLRAHAAEHPAFAALAKLL